MNGLVDSALTATRESRNYEFKHGFDPRSTQEWCELLKDIFALANSGGGVVVFGVDNGGAPVGSDLSRLEALDPAQLTDKVESYTGVHFDGFAFHSKRKNDQPVICLEIQDAIIPLVPRSPGTYPVPGSTKQDRAFSAGVVYFRHGAKSEPATSDDLAKLIERRVVTAKKDVLRNVRRVVSAPPGSAVEVLVPTKRKRIKPTAEQPQISLVLKSPAEMPVCATSSADAVPVRITTDPAAPAYHLVDPDQTHPYRMKDLLQEVNKQINSTGRRLSGYDIRAIDSAHGVLSRIEFSYKSQFGPRKYSPQFAAWVVEQMKRDYMFHLYARATHRRLKRQQPVLGRSLTTL